ncbi:MAG: hypothetical protein ABSB11_10395 [Sedimentisphaerales bacterium]|jgi:hypothetical protein
MLQQFPDPTIPQTLSFVNNRFARKAGLTRLCLGKGKNGTVMYLREEVVAYEKQRLISTK